MVEGTPLSAPRKARSANIFDPDVRRIVQRIAVLVERDGAQYVAERAGVSVGTLRNWVNYKTLSPQSAKLFTVARAVGLRVRVE